MTFQVSRSSQRNATRRDDRRQRERDLVPDSSGGMFVDLRRRTFWISEDPPALHHRFGQMMRFSRRHPAEEHRHGQRAHLVIGNVADHEILDQVVDFLGRQRLAVPFLFNERWEMHDLGRNESKPRARERAHPVRQSDGLVPWRARTQRPIGCQAVFISTVSDARQKLAATPRLFHAGRFHRGQTFRRLRASKSFGPEDGPAFVPRR